MNFYKKMVVCSALIFSSGAFAIPTGDKLVDQIGVQGLSPDIIEITNLSGWGASGCESAKIVVLDATVNNRQEMLSLILAAKMASKPIRFYGQCDQSNSNKFRGTYTIIK